MLLLSLPGPDRPPHGDAGRVMLPFMPPNGVRALWRAQGGRGQCLGSKGNTGDQRSGNSFLLPFSKYGEKKIKRKRQPDTLFCPCLWLRISCTVGLPASVHSSAPSPRADTPRETSTKRAVKTNNAAHEEGEAWAPSSKGN